MRNIKEDLYILKEMAKYNLSISSKYHTHIYSNTNERLREILTSFCFEGKDVLSVMASADQPLSAYYLGARSVDTFDISWPSYYFYFLKKWYVMHYKQAEFISSKRNLEDCLVEYDKSSDIECAMYEVWKTLLTNIWGIHNLFLKNLISFEWNVPYLDDYDKFIESVRGKVPRFEELDITSQCHVDKKYDIIILSNIMETIKINDIRNKIIAFNLRNLLNENGIVINSIVNDVTGALGREREAFIKDFDYEISDLTGYNPNSDDDIPLYYTYKRK